MRIKLKWCCGYARALNRVKNELHSEDWYSTITLKKSKCYKQTEYLEYCCDRCKKIGIESYLCNRYDMVTLRLCCDWQHRDFQENKTITTWMQYVKGFLYIDCKSCYENRKSDPDKEPRDHKCTCEECLLGNE